MTVTREETKPQVVEIKVAEQVWFVNASGGTPMSRSPATMRFSSVTAQEGALKVILTNGGFR